MNNFKTILSVAVFVAMSGAAQATDITLTGNATGAGTVVADGDEYAKFSTSNAMASTNAGIITTTGTLGAAGGGSTISLGATAKSFVVAYSATGTSANQSLTQVHDANGDAPQIIAASAFQASSNSNTGAVNATGSMADMALTALAQDSMIYSVSATGAGASQSVTPDIVR